MGIEATCKKCGETSPWPRHQAGIRVRCPSCCHVFTAPFPKKDPEMDRWYLKTMGGQLLGPLPEGQLRNLGLSGVLTSGCDVMKESTMTWQWAGETFNNLLEQQSYASRTRGAAIPLVGGVATAGLIERLPDDFGRLSPEQIELHKQTKADIESELSTIENASFIGERVLISGSFSFGPRFSELFKAALSPSPLSPTHFLSVFAFSDGISESFLVVPNAMGSAKHHEFFSLVPVALPEAIGLKQHPTNEDVGQWVGSSQDPSTPMATTAKISGNIIGPTTNWREFGLQWAFQAVPFGISQAMHIISQGRNAEKGFEIEHYIRKQRNFWVFVNGLHMEGGDFKGNFLFPSHSANVFSRMFSKE